MRAYKKAGPPPKPNKKKAKKSAIESNKERPSPIAFGQMECPACHKRGCIVFQSRVSGNFYAQCLGKEKGCCRGRFVGHDATLHFMRWADRRRSLTLDEDVCSRDVFLEQLKRIKLA